MGTTLWQTAAHEVHVADLDVTFWKTAPDHATSRDPEALYRAIESLPAGRRQAIELLNAIGSRFLFVQIAAIMVSAAAAAAAFASVVPGTSSARVVLWPAVALTVWLGGLFVGSRPEMAGGRSG